MSIIISYNSWSGFIGLFFLDGSFNYVIDNRAYNAEDLVRYGPLVDVDEILRDWDRVPAFNVDPQGSQVLAIESEDEYMIYQQRSNGQFIELTPRLGRSFYRINTHILKIPLPNVRVVEGVFEEFPLRPIDESVLERINELRTPVTPQQILYSLNNAPMSMRITQRTSLAQTHNERTLQYFQRQAQIRPLTEQETRMVEALTTGQPAQLVGLVGLEGVQPSLFSTQSIRDRIQGREGIIRDPIMGQRTQARDILRSPTIANPISNLQSQEVLSDLFQQSYETLLKKLYGIPVVLPDFLILNGLRVSFIPFQQVSSIQIERYIIDPMLQPWAGVPRTPNRILTIFGQNGITYLVKVRYDSQSNQIYPPV